MRGAALGAALALGAATFYGFTIVLARLLADVGVSGVSLVFYRAAAACLVLVAGAALLRAIPPFPRGRWPLMSALAASSVLVAVGYITSIAFVPVTVAATIFYTYPVLIVLASPLVEGRRLTGTLLAVAVTAFAGVALVVGPAAEELDWRGVALAFLGAAAAAAQFFAGARARDVPLVTKLVWLNGTTVPASLAIGLAFGAMNPPGDLAAAPILAFLALATFFAALALQFLALARASASATGLSFCFEPVVAAGAAALLLGERIGPVQVAGVALVVAAIAGNVLIERRRASPTPAG